MVARTGLARGAGGGREAHAPGHRVGADENQVGAAVARSRERALGALRPVLGVPRVEQRARAGELARVRVERVDRRVGDGIAVALEEAHDRHLAEEELPRARLARVGAVVGDFHALRAASGFDRPAAGVQAVAAPRVVGLPRGGGELGEQLRPPTCSHDEDAVRPRAFGRVELDHVHPAR